MLYLFRNGQFVRLFAGRMITNVGDSLYFVATMWLVYELTGSTFYTGIAGSLLLLPQALQFLTGPLVDRLPLHRILVTTQLTQAFLVLTIPLTMAYGTPSVYLVLAVIFILELLNQLAYPAHTAALPRIVPAEELVGANAILSFAHQGSNLVFNAAAGLLLPIVGVLSIYLIDSATFLLAGWLFSGLILAARDSRGAPILGRSSGFRNILTEYLSDLNDGLRHVFRTIIAHIMAGSLVATLCMGVVVAILPQYALTRGGAEIYGFLLAAQTGGILLGSVLATKVDHYPLGYLVIVLFAGGAAAWLASILVPWNILSIVLFGLAWIPAGMSNVLFLSVLQRMVPAQYLGRVTSVVVSLGSASMPLGSFLGGLLGDLWGSGLVGMLCAMGFFVVALYWVLHPSLRRFPSPKETVPDHFGLEAL